MGRIFTWLKYPSTWQGLVGIVAFAGVSISPDQEAAIVQAAIGVITAIALFFSDADVKPSA